MLPLAILRRFGRFLPRVEVPIRNLVHFTALRYGSGDYNPYESFLIDVNRGQIAAAQRTFVEFLRHYRPRHLGEALGVSLAQKIPLWYFPWEMHFPGRWSFSRGWKKSPGKVPDIITHFSDAGILVSRISEEFSWLLCAYDSICREGYQPERYHNFVEILTLVDVDGARAHLLLDGNHRVSALSALGVLTVRAIEVGVVWADDVYRWPCIRSGRVSAADGLSILRAYFHGNRSYRTAEKPASLLGDVHALFD